MLEAPYCPNPHCKHFGLSREQKNCPDCGAPAIWLGINDGTDIRELKEITCIKDKLDKFAEQQASKMVKT